MFAILGSISFDLIPGLEGLETRIGANYAEHSLFGAKPRLQFTGKKLDEIRMDMLFHFSFCDPGAEWRNLQSSLKNHEVLPLVFGNGDYVGKFILTDLTVTMKQNAPDGTLRVLGVQASLKEFTGKAAQPSAPAVISENGTVSVPSSGSLVSAASGMTPSALGDLSTAVSDARAAVTAATRVTSAISGVIRIPQSSALSKLPGIARIATTAMQGINSTVGKISVLASGAILDDANRVMTRLTNMGPDASVIASTLSSVNSDNFKSALATASSAATRITNETKQILAPLARMAVPLATRIL